MERRLAAILAADVVGYSRLMEADEEGTHAALSALWDAVFDPSIATYRGRTVKRMGDGFLAEFVSIVDAVNCAVTLQESIPRSQAETAPERRITLRIGVNLGDVIVEEGDLFGEGVNLAARLESLARPGGVCIPAKVHDEIRGKIEAPFRDLGETEVKNLSYPVHVFEHAIGLDASQSKPVTDYGLEMPNLRLKLLGPFKAFDAMGREITIPGRKTELLLAILAKAGRRGMPREKIIGLLWSDRGEEQARSSLRQALWSLRRALEDCRPLPLRTEESLVALDPMLFESDIMAFERLADESDPQSLEKAVQLFEGEFLEGATLRDPAGEDWLFYERERLTGVARGLFLRFLKHLIQIGHGSHALEIGQRLLAFDPLEEEAHRALMRLYNAQGQRTLALQQYEICAKALRRELGIRPEEQTRALRSEIEGSRHRSHYSADAYAESVGAPVSSRDAPSGAIMPRGERKQATVLSVDFVNGGFADLDADPEDDVEQQRRDVVAITTTIQQYGGEVQAMPDSGLVALFGAPLAFEDHALRACMAALDLSREADGAAAMRFGVNSGEVVIRPSKGGAFSGFDTFGPTVPLAVRIMDLLGPGRIAISESTYRQAAGAVEVANRRTHTVPGLTRPLEIWDLEDVPEPSARFRAVQRRGLTPFVGREEDSYIIRQAARRAAQGRGRAVALAGEPGVGKSRLVHEFLAAIAQGEWRVLATGVASFGKATAYGPLLAVLRDIFSLTAGQSRSSVAEGMQTALSSLGNDLDALVAPLSAVLDLPVEDFFWRELSSEEKHDRILDAAVALLQRLAEQKKVVLLIEDLHWIDTRSKGFLDRLLDGIAAIPIFVLVNFRPEFAHDWAGRSGFQQINLEPLEDEDAAELAQVLLGMDESVSELKRHLIERTRGMPLYLEESVRSLFETGFLIGEIGAYRLADVSAEAALNAVPPTVQSVIAARIDRLAPSAKRLLQSAAVIGRDFSWELLSAVAEDNNAADLQDNLAALRAADFIQELRRFPKPDFIFKHAFTQEVAYASLLKDERRELHKKIADTLKQDFPERCEDSPEILAHHLTEAGVIAEAIDLWRQAGEKAARRVASAEACAHFERGIALLPELGDDPSCKAKEAALRIGYGVPLVNLTGADSDEVLRNYEIAADVCRDIGDGPRLYRAFFGQWMAYIMRAELGRVNRLADQLASIAEAHNDENLTLEAHHCQWTSSFVAGEFSTALDHVDVGFGLYRREAHHALTYEFAGHDPACCAHNISAMARWLVGEPEAAMYHAGRTLAFGLDLGHRTTLLEGLFCTTIMASMTRDLSIVEKVATGEAWPSLEELANERSGPYFESAAGVRGWITFHKGDRVAGLADLRDNIDAWLQNGAVWTMSFLTLAAEALTEAGAATEALEVMDKALAAIASRGARWYEAEVHRVRAEALIAADSAAVDQATDSLDAALVVAKRQRAKSLELRAATSLARLHIEHDRSDEVQDLLTPIVNCFDPALETQDLKAAKKLLADICWPLGAKVW